MNPRFDLALTGTCFLYRVVDARMVIPDFYLEAEGHMADLPRVSVQPQPDTEATPQPEEQPQFIG